MGPHRAREPAGNTAPGGLCDPRSTSFTEVPGWGPRDLCAPCGDPLPCPLSSTQGLTLSLCLGAPAGTAKAPPSILWTRFQSSCRAKGSAAPHHCRVEMPTPETLLGLK